MRTMNYNKIISRFISWIFITAAVLLSGFSFAWDNSNFIDSDFWTEWSALSTPAEQDTAIIVALFGTGTSTGTAYTDHWANNTCVPADMSVIYVATNDLNNTPNLAADTIYVLQWNQTLTQPINANNDCIAVISDSNSIIEHNTPLPPLQNSFFRATSANAGLIIDWIESIGGNSTAADHFLYTNQYDNITVNNIKAERFFGSAAAEGVLYFNGYSDNIGVFNSYIHNNTKRWIQIDTAQNVHITNNLILNNTIGIFSIDTINANIRNNRIYDNTQDGITLNTNINATIQNNQVFNNQGYGISLSASNTNTQINHSKIYNNGSAGIRAGNGTNTIISNMIIHNNGWDGIYIAGATTVWLVLDTIQSYNNQQSAIEIVNTSWTILHNLKLQTTNAYNTLIVTAWPNQFSTYYGNIEIYGQTANSPALVGWSASDLAITNLWRATGVITQVANTINLFPVNSFIFCELWMFHANLWMGMDMCSDYGVSSLWSSPLVFTNNGEPYYFGEKVLKQTAIPYYSGTNGLYPSNNTFNPQLYITDNSFGGRIQTTGWVNYSNDFIHYTNTNQLRIYGSQASEYEVSGFGDLGSLTPTDAFDPTTITGNILAGQQITITLPRTGDDGYKKIRGQFNTGWEDTNIYQLFRRYDTTGPDQIILQSPTQGQNVLWPDVMIDRDPAVDTGAGVSGYNYIVTSDSGFNDILFSGTVDVSVTDALLTNIWHYPNYYRQVQAFDNLWQMGEAVTGLFHYDFGYFDLVMNPTTFPSNSGQTIVVTSYDITPAIITDYNNPITFSVTGVLPTTPTAPYNDFTLPASYQFTGTDNGTHTFTGWVIITYPGIYEITVSDAIAGTQIGTIQVTVTGEALDIFSGSLSSNSDPITGPLATSWSTTVETDFPAGTTYGIDIDGTPFTSPWTALNPGDDIVIDLTTSWLPDGSYDIAITFTDSSGIYTQTIIVTVILDTTDPILAIQSPVAASYQTLNQPPLGWTVVETGAGMSGYTVVMSGTSIVYTAYNHMNNDYRSGTALVDWPRTMTLYGYDNAGNYGTATVSFIIDNTAPVIVSWYPHQVVIANPFTFTRNVIDTGGVSTSDFMLRDFYGNPVISNWTTLYATNVTPLQLNLGSALAPGIYRWQVKVNDNVWLTTTSPEFTFGIHNAIPWQIQGFMELQSSFGNIVSYGGNIYSNTTQIQAALFSNIATSVAINGAIVNPIIGVPLVMPFPYTIQAINLTPWDEAKSITALFTAWSLNPYSVAKQIILDTTAPSIPTLTAPINGVAVNGDIALSRSGASDAWADISGYVVQIATNATFTTLAASGTTANETINVASGTLAPWQYYRRVLTTDRVGNQSASEVESFTIAAPNTTVVVNGSGAIPNNFSISPITNANPNILYRSSPVTVWWLASTQRANVSVSAGTLIKNGTAIGTTGTAINGDILEIDLIASSNYDTQVSSTLTIGTKYAAFNLRTKTQDQANNGMTNTQRLQIRIIFDWLINTYGANDSRTLTLMMTLRTAIESMLGLTNYSQSQKDALEYFLTLVNGYINDNWGSNPFNGATYTARNGRIFPITFDTTRAAYTSPQFTKVAYFSSWTAMKLHIDIHNPGTGQGVLVGTVNNIDNVNRGNNVHVMPNGKIYRIEQSGGKRYSPDTISQKQFNTQAELLARLRASNPSIRHY